MGSSSPGGVTAPVSDGWWQRMVFDNGCWKATTTVAKMVATRTARWWWWQGRNGGDGMVAGRQPATAAAA